MRGVLNDAVSIYFLDATLAGAFVARWCAVTSSRPPMAYFEYGMMRGITGRSWTASVAPNLFRCDR
jgi:hypothetical protein